LFVHFIEHDVLKNDVFPGLTYTLKMEEALYFGTLVSLYQFTWPHIQE